MSIPEHAIERQRNAIVFVTFIAKTLVLLSAGSIASILAFVGGQGTDSKFIVSDNSLSLLSGGVIFYILIILTVLMAAYSAYWSELRAYGAEVTLNNMQKHIKSPAQEVIKYLNKSNQWVTGLFSVSHILIIFATLGFLANSIFTTLIILFQ